MASLMSIFLGLVLFIPALAGSTPNTKESLREAMQNQDWATALNKIQNFQENEANESNKDLYNLVQAIVLHRQGKLEDSIKLLEPIKESSLYFAWAKVILARLAYQTQKTDLLRASLKAIEKVPLKGDIKVEKQFYDAHLLMQSQKWQQALKILKTIEKTGRRSDFHVPILESLVNAHVQSQSASASCAALLKLYIHYPLHPWIKETAPDLKNVKVDTKMLTCSVTAKQFDQRRRHLNILGEFKIVNEEINKWIVLRNLSAKEQKIIRAQQNIAEGHVEDAIKLFKEAQEGPADIQVLAPLSFAAAKVGDMNLAIDSALAIHKVLGNTKSGVMALYQAGVWAYQTRDYENATLRLKKVPLNRLSKGQRRDVNWYLAWLLYLKGDYVAAEKSFRSMLKVKNKKQRIDSPERVHYWLAMSLFRQNRLLDARPLFLKLSDLPGMNYYGMLANERLKQIQSRTPASVVTTESLAQVAMVGRAPYFTPYGDVAPRPSLSEGDANDELISLGESEEAANQSGEDNSSENSDEEKVVAESSESNGQDIFSQVEANQKLERARAFWAVGLDNFAHREVGDLERFSRNFELFKKIVDEYETMGLYNKLTVLGSRFSAKANFKANKFIYESMFPRAYSEYVEKYSEENNVPQALIWGIMKAESMYQPWVKSQVGALGLMQVMPMTGQRLAQMMSLKEFAPEMLLQPPHAIRFGSKYLERLGKKFDYSVPLMAAAYNAGPHRVTQWLYYFGFMQMDEWVEHIPFVETRNYVKRVTVNYVAYNELYGKKLGDPITLTDAVPVQIAGSPEAKESWD